MTTTQRHIARAAVLVTVLFMLSRALGLARTVVFGYYFGAGAEMDAYNYAAHIPELLFNVVAGGALGSAFIPVFTGRIATGNRAGAWQLATSLINLILVVLIPLCLLTALAAPWLVRVLIAPAAPAAVQARTVDLLRVLLLSPAIFGVSGVIMGALNGCQQFALPALAPLFYNTAIIAGAIWGGERGGGVMGAAVGAVIGALLHLGVQIPGLVREQARYGLWLGLRDTAVREVGLLMLPRVFGVAAVQFNFVITNMLASRLEVGAVSILAYAWMIVLLPNVLAQAVGTTTFPTLSAQAAQRDAAGLQHTLRTALSAIITLMTPAAVGLVLLGRPIIALAFERGAFSAGATESVAWALALFAVGLVGHGALEIIARAFYAVHDTWTPALAAAGAVALNVTLGLALPSLFTNLGWAAYGGLALANGLAALLEMLVLLAILGRRITGLPLRTLANEAARVLIASGGMAASLWLWLAIAPGHALIQTLGGVSIGVAIYGLLAWLLRVEALRPTVQLVLRRVGVMRNKC